MKEILKLVDVTKFYNTSSSVALGLRHVNATFCKGEFVAITGESGSGKSTLLNVLSGLDSYDEGEMLLAGSETSYFSEKEREEYRAKYVSFIFQDYNIIDSYTVFQNVELALLNKYPDKAERKAAVLSILKRVELDTHASHRGTKLSGGQKQRVSIARALAKDAPILFADEPTGNLDSATSIEVLRLLSELSKDKLVIVVTHNYEDLEPYATRRIRLYDGEVVEDKQLTSEEPSSLISTRRQENGLNTPIDGYAFSAEDMDEDVEDNAGSASVETSETQRKQQRKENLKKTRQYLKTLLTICLNNIKATPKRSIFTISGFIILTLAIMYACSSLFDTVVVENYRYNDSLGMRAYRYEMQVVSTQPLTPQQMEEIKAVSGVECVTQLSPSIVESAYSSYFYNFGLSRYLKYEGKSIYSSLGDEYVDGLYYSPKCIHSLSKLTEGREPTADNEIVISVSGGATTNNLLGAQLTLPYMSTPVTVVGLADSEEENAAAIFFSHNAYDQMLHTIRKANFYNYYYPWDENATPSTVTDDVYNQYLSDKRLDCSCNIIFSSTTDYNTMAHRIKALNDNYNTYYFFGVQDSTADLNVIMQWIMLLLVLFVMLLVLRIIRSSIRNVSQIKKRDYNIMRTVGISSSMLGRMYKVELYLSAAIAYIIGYVLMVVVYVCYLFFAQSRGSVITAAVVSGLFGNLLKAFFLGALIMAVFVAIVCNRFNKEFSTSTVKTALLD